MINFFLLVGIVLFFMYAVYDQFGMQRWKGKCIYQIKLKKQAQKDGIIFIVLIILLIYQTRAAISLFTLYLLITLILLKIYAAFIRTPVLLLKEKGFFFGNIYFQYANIHQLHLAENNILVIDMNSGKRLLVHLLTDEDRERVIQFFGGYK
ncbi:DUF986 family protein [Bisgaard Taxon 45]